VGLKINWAEKYTASKINNGRELRLFTGYDNRGLLPDPEKKIK